MHKILVVGQTPPPHGGQSIMIERILEQDYSRIKLFHIRMSFSKEMDDIGRFQLSKLWHLVSIVFSIFVSKIKYKTTVLYYPPAGPDKIPMYRDLVILICTRWMFKKTIFHFHAGGISELYPNLSKIEKFLFRTAYFHSDGSILLSQLNPRDDKKLLAKQNFVVPYGIEDAFQETNLRDKNEIPTILYVGILKESKGVIVLLDALKILHNKGVKFDAQFVGKFESKEFENIVSKNVVEHGLSECTNFTGVLTGDHKWNQFSRANIFCFPTFFESETFGLVVLEAMQFKLPVVASDWRGVPSDPELARTLGENGRKEYLNNYSISAFQSNIENVFVKVAEAL